MSNKELNSFLNAGGYPLKTIQKFLIDEVRRLADVFFGWKDNDVLYLHESIFINVAKEFRNSGGDKNSFPFKEVFRNIALQHLMALL